MSSNGVAADLAVLRRADPDRYIATLYAPAEKRNALTTLYLFNAEIAAIRDRIHDPLPGEIRIQWWRDALAGGGDAAAGHQLAMALLGVIEEHSLPLDAFDRYLEARIFDLYDDPMPSRGDLEGYCGETSSSIMQLSALILAPEAASAFADASGHGGCATAIASILRMLPLHRARGQCYFPADMLAAVGTDREELLAGDGSGSLRGALEAMIALGREHLAHFEAEARHVPAGLRPAFLPAAPVSAYLDRIAASPGDALVRNADITAVRRHWIMLRKATRGWR